MIIGIVGLIGSGKDTASNCLTEKYNFKKESFAGPLKDVLSSVFGWDRDQLEGATPESRKWRETPDEWWSTRLDREISPRAMMQMWGTDIARNTFHNEIWVANLENRLRNTTDNVVISDLRFPNEIQAIRKLGGIIVNVSRGPAPVWWPNAVETASCTIDNEYIIYDEGIHMEVAYPEVHASEWAWAATKFDHVLENNGTIEEFETKVINLVESLLYSN